MSSEQEIGGDSGIVEKGKSEIMAKTTGTGSGMGIGMGLSLDSNETDTSPPPPYATIARLNEQTDTGINNQIMNLNSVQKQSQNEGQGQSQAHQDLAQVRVQGQGGQGIQAQGYGYGSQFQSAQIQPPPNLQNNFMPSNYPFQLPQGVNGGPGLGGSALPSAQNYNYNIHPQINNNNQLHYNYNNVNNNNMSNMVVMGSPVGQNQMGGGAIAVFPQVQHRKLCCCYFYCCAPYLNFCSIFIGIICIIAFIVLYTTALHESYATFDLCVGGICSEYPTPYHYLYFNRVSVRSDSSNESLDRNDYEIYWKDFPDNQVQTKCVNSSNVIISLITITSVFVLIWIYLAWRRLTNRSISFNAKYGTLFEMALMFVITIFWWAGLLDWISNCVTAYNDYLTNQLYRGRSNLSTSNISLSEAFLWLCAVLLIANIIHLFAMRNEPYLASNRKFAMWPVGVNLPPGPLLGMDRSIQGFNPNQQNFQNAFHLQPSSIPPPFAAGSPSSPGPSGPYPRATPAQAQMPQFINRSPS